MGVVGVCLQAMEVLTPSTEAEYSFPPPYSRKRAGRWDDSSVAKRAREDTEFEVSLLLSGVQRMGGEGRGGEKSVLIVWLHW